MSDHIEHDGKRYIEETYLILANNNSARKRDRIAELEVENSRLKEALIRANNDANKYNAEANRLKESYKILDACLTSSAKENTRLTRDLEEARYQAFHDMAKALCIGCSRGDEFESIHGFHLSSCDGLPTHQCRARVLRLHCPPAFAHTKSTPVAEPKSESLIPGSRIPWSDTRPIKQPEADPVLEEREK
jgi:hypothetical protein